MRNGNSPRITLSEENAPVLILPMRNGNFLYEFFILNISILVLILPMRNGNSKSCWVTGIKDFVLILPMRNGNWFFLLYFCFFFLNVLILPMRNGNPWNKSFRLQWVVCSYPTYEEWKLTGEDPFSRTIVVLILPMRNGNIPRCHNPIRALLGSYPTYEEWKPDKVVDGFKAIISSYPTYEEWKHTLTMTGAQIAEVLILPMRNGNILQSNQIIQAGTFLSYLWGMETLQPWLDLCQDSLVLILPMRNGNQNSFGFTGRNSLGSYPTYEEWKQPKLFFEFRKTFEFLSYLWGMETK